MAKKKSFYKVARNQEVEQVEGTSYRIKELPDMEFFFYKDTIWHEQKNEFQKIFGFPPPICVLTGRLDVLKLDNLLKPTEGTSLSDFVSSKYGESTAKLVEEML